MTPHSHVRRQKQRLVERKLALNRVWETSSSKAKRSLLAFSFSESEITTTKELVIETSRHNYTEDYINLTKDFYLKM